MSSANLSANAFCFESDDFVDNDFMIKSLELIFAHVSAAGKEKYFFLEKRSFDFVLEKFKGMTAC